MIIGDPFSFAIVLDVAKNWNDDDSFGNGILFFCVDSELYPNVVISTTLKSEIPRLKGHLENIVVNQRIYNLPKNEAYNEMYNITFPNDFSTNNNYMFIISTQSQIDNDCLVFAVSDGNNIRILAAKLNYCKELSAHMLTNAQISEIYVNNSQMKDMLRKLSDFF